MIRPQGPLRGAALMTAAVVLLAGAVLAFTPGQPRAAASSGGWVATWTASPMAPALPGPSLAVRGFDDQTVRDIVFTSIGGSAIRIRLSNTFGVRSLVVGQVTVGPALDRPGVAGAAVTAAALTGTEQQVLFDGRATVRVPPGAEVVSDPVPIAVTPLEDLAVSIYLPGPTGPTTYHLQSQQLNYLAVGDHAADATGAAFTTTALSWYILDGVDVLAASRHAYSVVAFGDSITDGVGSADDANDRWPDRLARRLDALLGSRAPGVVDEGIGGNRVLNGSACFGASALARFDRDVLDQPGVRYVIMLEGINDIGFGGRGDAGCLAPDTVVTAAQIIAGYKNLIAAAHAHGLKIFGCTLTPFRGSWVWTPAAQAKLDTVNRWIRTSHAFDGVFDFARVLQEPGHPEYLNPAYNSWDGLHPNDAGYAAMANAIPLSLLT
jgi:lysophospholipase L1-like esterase